MIAVPDEEILRSIKILAETEGIFAESSGVACLAGLRKLVQEKWMNPEEKIVLLVTGNGLKDVDNALKVSGSVIPISPDLNEVLNVLNTC